jgi:hypothetical protein
MKIKKQKPHYVNNKEFSQSVHQYVKIVNDCEESESEIPKVPNDIALAFMNIAEGLSHRPNFIRYTYRDEMVMDAVENCLKAIKNYNLEAATRSGKPNAFSYFTQISWYAFLRRIEKEKKQEDIRKKFIAECGVEAFISIDKFSASDLSPTIYVDQLKTKVANIKYNDSLIKHYSKKQKNK